MADVADVAEENGISIALTPVQLYAILNGKSISQGELASNTWHEMPLPPDLSLVRYLRTLPETPTRQDAWARQSHYSQPRAPDCWVPPPIQRSSPPPDPAKANRIGAALQIIGGGLEIAGGAFLLLLPDPTLLTKVGGSALALHGADVTQAAIRQLFSGKPVEDFTQMGGSWAAHEMGASAKNAQRVGVILDVAVPITVSAGLAVEKVLAIRAGRIVLSEEAVADETSRTILPEEAQDGKAGRISLQDEEDAGGHTRLKHINRTDRQLADRLIDEPYIPASSCWTSVRIAEDVITDTIRSNKAVIEAWTKSGQVRLELKYLGSSPVGRGIVRATGKMQPMTNAIVRLRKTQMVGRTYFILTSYPAP
jgi:hypothetical protein